MLDEETLGLVHPKRAHVNKIAATTEAIMCSIFFIVPIIEQMIRYDADSPLRRYRETGKEQT